MSKKEDQQVRVGNMPPFQPMQPALRMQQLLHGIRLSASEDLAPADDLDRLARLIQQRRAFKA